MRAHVVPGVAEMGGRGPEAPRLLPELVGGDEEDAHRFRLRASMSTSSAACAVRSDASTAAGRVAAREQEAEVAVALGERHDRSARAAR